MATKTVKVYIDWDEDYPVFDACETEETKSPRSHGVVKRVSRSRLEKWERIQKDYDKMQEELRRLSGYGKE